MFRPLQGCWVAGEPEVSARGRGWCGGRQLAVSELEVREPLLAVAWWGAGAGVVYGTLDQDQER